MTKYLTSFECIRVYRLVNCIDHFEGHPRGWVSRTAVFAKKCFLGVTW